MIEIKWNDLILVAGTAIGVSAFVVTFFAIGIRLLSNAQHAAIAGKGKKKDTFAAQVAYRLAAVLAFAVSSSVMMIGLYIIVTFSKAVPK